MKHNVLHIFSLYGVLLYKESFKMSKCYENHRDIVSKFLKSHIFSALQNYEHKYIMTYSLQIYLIPMSIFPEDIWDKANILTIKFHGLDSQMYFKIYPLVYKCHSISPPKAYVSCSSVDATDSRLHQIIKVPGVLFHNPG